MKVKGYLDISLSDWDGKVCSVIFLGGCNFRCPYCYNVDLVLNSNKIPDVVVREFPKVVNGVCITGGEPTLFNELEQLCKMIKRKGLLVKLDTNGSNPEVIEHLAVNDLIDYVAVDVKTILHNCSYIQYTKVPMIEQKVWDTLATLQIYGVDYEARTTVFKPLHSVDSVPEIARDICFVKKYVIQNFDNRRDVLGKNMNLEPFTQTELDTIVKRCRHYIPNTTLRQ